MHCFVYGVFLSRMKEGRWYRRKLVAPGIEFSSSRGRELFRGSLEEGNCESFFPLSMNFETQAEPSFCGIGSLSMCLNALEIDPNRPWISPTSGEPTVWRFYSELMLDCCEPLDRVRKKGITFDKVHCLASCNGADSAMVRAEDSELGAFRSQLKECCSLPGKIMLCTYSRRVLNQTGDGHFSPVAAYNEKEDHVLIFDVARFKYKPHYVPVACLYEAMLPEDSETGKSRGWLVLSKAEEKPGSLSINCRGAEKWTSSANFFKSGLLESLLGASGLREILSKEHWATLILNFSIDGGDKSEISSAIHDTSLYKCLESMHGELCRADNDACNGGNCDEENEGCFMGCRGTALSAAEAFTVAFYYAVLFSGKSRELAGLHWLPESVVVNENLGEILFHELTQLHLMVEKLNEMSCC